MNELIVLVKGREKINLQKVSLLYNFVSVTFKFLQLFSLQVQSSRLSSTHFHVGSMFGLVTSKYNF